MHMRQHLSQTQGAVTCCDSTGRLDAAFTQVGAIGAGGVGLVAGHGGGPGAGTADGQADPFPSSGRG